MPAREAPCVELGSAPETPSAVPSPSPSEMSSTSSAEPQVIRASPLFRVLAMPPPEPPQPPGQDELERRLPGYRRIVIPRDLTLIELLKQYSGVTTDDEVLRIREAKLKVVAERVGLRRLHVLAPRLSSLTLDGSAISSLRELGIGLTKLKFLSINRCNLTSLDGIWGLSALRELHATGNQLQDLQPLAVLQKLHTLDLADNPIAESSRLWTLGVCSALRRLTLKGSPASAAEDYRTRVASALPMLTHLDDRLLHGDDVDDDADDIFGNVSSSSDSEPEEEKLPEKSQAPPAEPEPGPSCSTEHVAQAPSSCGPDGDSAAAPSEAPARLRRRPATTEGVSQRPERPRLPPRPHTAQPRRARPLSRLQIMNTLMDDEWRCSGSSLTSHGAVAVCGNLAQALRRPARAAQHSTELSEVERQMAEETLRDASRALAAEIPRAHCVEDWAKFRQITGIDIDIDFNARPVGADPMSAIERLESIELETRERLQRESVGATGLTQASSNNNEGSKDNTSDVLSCLSYDYETWRGVEDLTSVSQNDLWGEVDAIFNHSVDTPTECSLADEHLNV